MQIGKSYKYTGTTHPWATGTAVYIFAVHKGDKTIYDNRTLAEAGGIGPDDIIEFQPVIQLADGGTQVSFATSDARLSDFELSDNELMEANGAAKLL